MLDSGDLARRYAYPENLRRPWVRASFASTADGSATAGDGVSGDLGGDADDRVFTVLRTLCDVVLVGAGTARAESYAPVLPDEVDGRLRARLGLSPTPPIAVVSERLEFPSALIAPGQLVITHAGSPQRRRAELARTMDVIVAGDDEIHWPTAIAALAERGHRRVQCEGGPTLHGALVDADRIDELCLTIAPMLAAGDGPRIARSPRFAGRTLRLDDLIRHGNVLLTRWTRVDGA